MLDGGPPFSPMTLGGACSVNELLSSSANVGKESCPGTHLGERISTLTCTEVFRRVEKRSTHQGELVPKTEGSGGRRG